jgi:hypothetical protein
MRRQRRGVTFATGLALLAAAWAAGCQSSSEPDQDPFNFEGNWTAVFTVVSTNGALLDTGCRQLAVGDQVTPALAIAQDGDSIVVNVVPSQRWAAFRLTGKVDGEKFDGTGELTTGCDQSVHFGIRGERINDDSISGEMTGTRAGLTGKLVFSARRV